MALAQRCPPAMSAAQGGDPLDRFGATSLRLGELRSDVVLGFFAGRLAQLAEELGNGFVVLFELPLASAQTFGSVVGAGGSCTSTVRSAWAGWV